MAKDFGRSTKEVTDILTKYAKAPKNHMQVLDDHELSIIFEYFTQNHQVDDLERVLGSQQAAPAGGKKEAAPVKEAAPKADEGESKEEKKEAPRSSRVKQVHRIDTRGGGDVNLAKYDERIDSLVSEKAEADQEVRPACAPAVWLQAPSGGAGEDEAPAAPAADGQEGTA